MSLLGIDIGTTGCKAAVFTPAGKPLSLAYQEYDVRSATPGRAELDPGDVWAKVLKVIREAAKGAEGDPIQALSVSSLGEAVVPVGKDRSILGPSILNFDARGAEYIDGLRKKLDPRELYRVNGNPLENSYTLPKLMWIRDREPGSMSAPSSSCTGAASSPSCSERSLQSTIPLQTGPCCSTWMAAAGRIPSRAPRGSRRTSSGPRPVGEGAGPRFP